MGIRARRRAWKAGRSGEGFWRSCQIENGLPNLVSLLRIEALASRLQALAENFGIGERGTGVARICTAETAIGLRTAMRALNRYNGDSGANGLFGLDGCRLNLR
jgi:hypothetical protein